jgi:hypothetical protein
MELAARDLAGRDQGVQRHIVVGGPCERIELEIEPFLAHAAVHEKPVQRADLEPAEHVVAVLGHRRDRVLTGRPFRLAQDAGALLRRLRRRGVRETKANAVAAARFRITRLSSR